MKKTPKLDTLPPSSSSWSSSLDEHPLIQWMSDHGKTLLYALIGLLLLILLTIRWIAGSQSASEMDFLTAEKDFVTFASPLKAGSDPSVQTQALQNLKKILSAHPELHAKYDGLLAEVLLIRGENAEALGFARSSLQRTADENDPFYTHFAQTNLLISENKFEEALKESLALKEAMEKQGSDLQNRLENIQFSTLLYAYNLLRTGLLQQELSLHQEEAKTWQEWKQLLNKSHEGSLPRYLDGQLFIAFDQLLSEGTSTFTNYIESLKIN